MATTIALLACAWALLVPAVAQASQAADLITLPDPEACANLLLAGDLTGDGRDELIVGCAFDAKQQTPPIYVYRRGDDGAFTRIETVRPPAGIGCSAGRVGDVNGDHRIDLVVECYANEDPDKGTWLYERADDGSAFEAGVHLPPPDGTTGCGLTDVRDMDADGRDEVLTVCRTPATFESVLATYHRASSGVGFDAPTTTRLDTLLGPRATDCTWIGIADIDGRAPIDHYGVCHGRARVFVAGLPDAVEAPASPLSCTNPGAADVVGDDRVEVVRMCFGPGGSAVQVMRVELGSASTTFIGMPGPIAVKTAPITRCSKYASFTALRGFGTVAKTLALGCDAYEEFGAGAVFQVRTTGDPTLRDLVRRTPLRGATCGGKVAAGDFDGDGRDDLAMSCLPTGRTWLQGDNHVAITLGAVAMQATAGNDMLIGTDARDRLSGGAGNDLLRGAGGNDLLRGQAGRDTIDGGAGNDTLAGGSQRDVLDGGRGNDTLLARDGGRDIVNCGLGRDVATVDRADVVRDCETVHRA